MASRTWTGGLEQRTRLRMGAPLSFLPSHTGWNIPHALVVPVVQPSVFSTPPSESSVSLPHSAFFGFLNIFTKSVVRVLFRSGEENVFNVAAHGLLRRPCDPPKNVLCTTNFDGTRGRTRRACEFDGCGLLRGDGAPS